VKVLEQAIYYINDIRRLHTAKVDYVMCYFRPDNAFPNKVFGDFARDLNNPQVSSLDLFSYLPFPVHSTVTPLPDGWVLRKTSKRDLSELNRFYSYHSRGLLLNALGLEQVGMGSESLEEVYARSGFMRRLALYSLTKDNDLIALLIANQSDVGLNLSEFLNGIKILITKKTGDWEIISCAIAQLAHLYTMKKIPILIYPMEYVETNSIPYEKQYQLWILNLRYGNEYLEYNRIKYGFGDE
jgi:hypothetical protein